MATLTLDQGVATFPHLVPTVYTRAVWADSWVEQTQLRCVSTRVVGSAIGTSTFVFHYGSIDGSTVLPLDVMRHWVKVEIPTAHTEDDVDEGIVWFGVITDEVRSRHGYRNNIRQGDQQLTAVDLTWLLTRRQLVQSVVHVEPASTKTVNRALPFNTLGVRGQAQAFLGNRQNSVEATERFAENLETPGADWTAYQIIQYLLEHFAPTSDPSWDLDTDAPDYLDWFPVITNPHGKTLFELINTLISQRRGLIWYPELDLTESIIILRIASSALTDVDIGAKTLIKANPSQVDFDVDDIQDVSGVTWEISSQRKYEQICVQGGRRGVVATFSWMDGSFQQGWDPFGEVQDIKDGANASAGYGALNLSEQQALNDKVRSSEELSHVFTRWVLDEVWDGTTGSGDGTDARTPAFQNLDGAGDPDGTLETYWKDGLHFASFTPMLEGFDYSADVAVPVNNSDNAITHPNFVRPLAFAQVEIDSVNRWSNIDKISSAFSEHEELKFESCGIQVHQKGIGANVGPNSAPVHVIAAPGFALTADAPSGYPPSQVDHETVVVTGYIEQDSYVESCQPATPGAAVNGMQSVHYIRLDEKYRLDWMADNTALGTTENGLDLVKASEGWIRDDRPFMDEVAKTAWEWYSTDRNAINVKLAHVSSALKIGQLVTSIGSAPTSDTVNTLVTSVVYNWDQNTTSIQTTFFELDFANV